MRWERRIKFHASAYRYSVFPAPFVEDVVFSTVRLFGIFINCQVPTGEWTCIWVLNSIPLVIASVFVPVPSKFYSCDSVVGLAIMNGIPPAVFLLSRAIAALWGFCVSIWPLLLLFFNLWEELPWNHIRIVLNLRIAFGRMVVFTVSVLPFHEHEDLCAFLFLSFHFLVFEHFHCIGLFRGIL